MRIISASMPTARPSRTRSGPMRRRSRRWRKYPAIWRSIRTGSRSRKWPKGSRAGSHNVIASVSEAIHCGEGRWIASLTLAMTEFGAFPPSNPEDRQPQDQQHQEDHDEDVKQEAGEVRRRRRYAGEA